MKLTLLAALLLLLNTFTLAKHETFFSPQDDLEDVVVENIQKATSTIDISIYTFSSNSIKNALISKLNNGVKVRVIVENGDEPEIAEKMEGLIENGAQVRYVTKVNHNKFMIVDEDIFLNSSGNFTGSSRSKTYDENMVVCDTCDAHVEAFTTEFEKSFALSNRVGAANDPVSNLTREERSQTINKNVEGVALFTSANFTPRVSTKKNKITEERERVYNSSSIGHDRRGQGNVDKVLVQAIDSAQSSVKVAMVRLRSKPLHDALVRAVQRDVKVELLLDGQDHVSTHKQRQMDEKIAECTRVRSSVDCHTTGIRFARKAAEAGVQVSFKYYMYRWHYPYAKQMHHKYMIIDDQTVYSGSYNWAYNAEFNSFENVAIYTNQDVLAGYQENFQELLNYGGAQAGYRRLVRAIEQATDSIPTVFEPVTLTTQQIDDLKAKARSKCPRLYTNSFEARSCRF